MRTPNYPNRTLEAGDAAPAPPLQGTFGNPLTLTPSTIVATHAMTLRGTAGDHFTFVFRSSQTPPEGAGRESGGTKALIKARNAIKRTTKRLRPQGSPAAFAPFLVGPPWAPFPRKNAVEPIETAEDRKAGDTRWTKAGPDGKRGRTTRAGRSQTRAADTSRLLPLTCAPFTLTNSSTQTPAQFYNYIPTAATTGTTHRDSIAWDRKLDIVDSHPM